jgi:outer membrane protein OmpA-like peptidoglycan-associated protein
MNLFENFDDIINDDFIAKLKSHTNDNLGDIEVAVKGVFYTLVAGLIRRTNSDMSAGMLFNQIKEKFKVGSVPQDHNLIFTEKGLLEKISEDGSKIISQIFPAYKSPLLSMIGSYAGTSKNVTVVAAGLTSSILIDMLGKKIDKENLDKEGLVYYLKQHHESLLNKAPESLMEKMIPALGLQELINSKIVAPKKPEPAKNTSDEESDVAVVQSVSEKYNEDEETETFFNKKILLVLLAVAIIGAIGYFLYANNGQFSFLAKDETPVESLDEELLFADSVANIDKDSVKVDSAAIQTVAVPANVSEFNNFKQYVLDDSKGKGEEFDFKSIQYLDKTFDLTSESVATIDSIAHLMNTSKNLQIKITAFSEAGDLKLNNKRAFAVKKVLMAKGVNTIRIDAGSGGNGGNFPKIKVVTK